MYKLIGIALLAFAVLAPMSADAQGFAGRGHFTLPATALGPNTFEIIEADGAGGSQIWCGAGIYARQVLGQRGGDITIVEGRGASQTQPGRKSVIFTTNPVAGSFGSYSTGISKPGTRFSMTQAFAQCSDLPNFRLRLPDGRLVRRGI